MDERTAKMGELDARTSLWLVLAKLAESLTKLVIEATKAVEKDNQ